MTDTSATAADTYALVVPREWVDLPVTPDEFETFKSDLLARIRAERELSRTEERRIEILMRQILHDLRTANVRSAALFAHTDDDSEDAQISLAGLTLSRLDQPDLGTTLPLTVDVLMSALGNEPRADQRMSYINLEAPSTVELAAGIGVRVRRRYRTKLSPTDALEYYSEAFLVPHDEGTAVCTLQFTTPDVEDGSLYSKLFDAIARTLRIFTPADPTVLGEPVASE